MKISHKKGSAAFHEQDQKLKCDRETQRMFQHGAIKDSTLKNITKTWTGTVGSVEERATNIYKMKQLIFPFGNTGSAVSSIPCIWFIFSSKEHSCHLILITDPTQRGAWFTTETDARVFASQELSTWLIARFPVTQLVAQLAAAMVDARPFTGFLQQQYKYHWFV